MWRLHHLDDPECRLFQDFMDAGIYANQAGGGSTRQGIFAVAPSGRLLADVNTTRPDQMRSMLQRALRAWKDLPKDERLLPYDPETRRAQIQRQTGKFPQDGVPFRVYVRDLTRQGNDWKAKAWNVDTAWFRAGELRGLLPDRVKKKATKEWPKPLALRLVRLHLTDYVRGQTNPVGRSQVHEATLSTEVVKVKKKGVTLKFSGRARLSTGDWSDTPDVNATRGVDATILGEAVWDRRKNRYSSFEIVVVGVRWGRTQFNFRQGELGPSPIGWVFTLAPDDERVAPAHFGDYGW